MNKYLKVIIRAVVGGAIGGVVGSILLKRHVDEVYMAVAVAALIMIVVFLAWYLLERFLVDEGWLK